MALKIPFLLSLQKALETPRRLQKPEARSHCGRQGCSLPRGTRVCTVARRRGGSGCRLPPSPVLGSQPRLIPSHKDAGAPYTSRDRPTNQGWALRLEHLRSARRISFLDGRRGRQEIRPDVVAAGETGEIYSKPWRPAFDVWGRLTHSQAAPPSTGGEIKAREGRICPGPTAQWLFWAPCPRVQPVTNLPQRPWPLPPCCVGLPSKAPNLGAFSLWGTCVFFRGQVKPFY